MQLSTVQLQVYSQSVTVLCQKIQDMGPLETNAQRENGINKVHFVSDGPTSQYRNRTNSFLLANISFSLGFECVTWHFTESSHGKGPADGIGASLKNSAHQIMAHGGDGNINVTMGKASDDALADVEPHLNMMPSKSIKGAMTVHKILVNELGSLHHRTLSCYCKGSGHKRDCHPPKTESMLIIPTADHADPTSVISRIENNLMVQQINLFETRLAEGYDVEILDFEALLSD
ncbi:uncharacterized protein LOC143248330 [Tachypleus tridentatus]|uniref:uncharacterized protein LOC143248330 n=1 Tax=Tachypleus tridentatus TaxID=6853 RepID=UPI003FD19C98